MSIVLVNVATSVAKTIVQGTGIGAVRFDPSGKMFVQRDRRMFYATTPDDIASWRELPKGVLLVSPVVPEASIQCCGF